MSKPTRIYGIIDPRHGIVRYAGKTVDTLKRRLWYHIFAARKGGVCHRDRWLRSLLEDGQEPRMVRLDMVPAGEDWAARERFWIASCRHIVGDLMTNMSDGGDGVTGVPRTAEWREKIAAAQRGKKRKPLSEAHRQAISAFGTGRKCPKTPEHREKLRQALLGRKGVSPSEETRAKLRAAHLGRKKPPLTPEQERRWRSATLRGDRHPAAKLTPQDVLEIRAEPKGGKHLAERYGVCYGTIKHIRSRKIWSHI